MAEKENELKQKNRKTKRKKEPKPYTFYSNIYYTFHHLRVKSGTSALAVCGGDVVLSILLPFLETALSGAVVACLVSGRRPGEILLMIGGYVVLLQTARFLQGHVQALRKKALFMFRIHLMMDFYQKILEMDVWSLESAQGQKKREAAKRNLYSGNAYGIEAYATAFCDLVLNLGGLAVYGVIVGRASLLLLLLLILQTLLTSYLHTLAGRRAYAIDQGVEEGWLQFRYLRRESILPANGKDIRLYQMDRWFLKTFREIVQKICTLTDKEQTGFTAAGMAQNVLTFARDVVIYGYLIREMALGNLTLPLFLLYVGVVSGFEAWMSGLFEAAKQILENEKSMDGYRDFMDFGTVEEGEKTMEHPGNVHEIRLEHVCFCYGEEKEDTIHDLNLTIRPGEKLALVGLNGAGNTTLVKLMCGLYRPTSGKIYLDGQDMAALSRQEIFKEFAVVFQDVFAFSFPFVENVTCMEAGMEDGERLEKSLSEAGLWEKALGLPKGLMTFMNKDLDEKGVSLSGGEMQKLMLARALYKDAPVVILDEPTSALDPIAESELYEKYDDMIQGKTAVFISHRLSSTRFCDRILFLENGCVTEEGTHESLMEAGGAYAALFTLQARYYQKDFKEESYA